MEIVTEKRATIAGGVIACRALGSHDRIRQFGVQEGTAEAIGVKVGRYPRVIIAGRMVAYLSDRHTQTNPNAC